MNIFNTTRSYATAVLSVAVLGASLVGSSVAFAQGTTNGTTMPVIYNAAGVQVNAANMSALAPGYYYLTTGAPAASQIYYNGDGTFVNQASGLYAGSVSNPNGTAGVMLVFGTRTGGTTAGVPNTGMGGNEGSVWFTLIATAVIAVGGVAYLAKRKTVRAI